MGALATIYKTSHLDRKSETVMNRRFPVFDELAFLLNFYMLRVGMSAFHRQMWSEPAPVREITFLHTSGVMPPSTQFYSFINGIWQNLDPDSEFSGVTFTSDEIKDVVDWS